MGDHSCPYYYYTILEVPRDASSEDIKRAYRKLALRNHPDKTKDPRAHEKFKDINNAFEVLYDPVRRAVYDANGGSPVCYSRVSNDHQIDFFTGVAFGAICSVFLGGFYFMGVPSVFVGLSHVYLSHIASLDTQDPTQRKWGIFLGSLLSPAILAFSAGTVSLMYLLEGGRKTLEFTQTKWKELGDYINATYEQSKQKTLLDDDFVMIEDTPKKQTEEKKKKSVVIEEEEDDEEEEEEYWTML
eukprot:TRINITY_DN222_c0_g1_i1.p1 TRINITY_DN222_c0_g1~~TRINITY_DN222_c0_g1_i1.p1  ORF type:complete len:243 (+),score=49.74 TRINITY_DN222_c0_g1_i1:117-845(+)